MNQDFKNFLLILNVVNVLGIYDFMLFHSLDCVLFVWLILQPSHPHIAERTYNLVLVR